MEDENKPLSQEELGQLEALKVPVQAGMTRKDLKNMEPYIKEAQAAALKPPKEVDQYAEQLKILNICLLQISLNIITDISNGIHHHPIILTFDTPRHASGFGFIQHHLANPHILGRYFHQLVIADIF